MLLSVQEFSKKAGWFKKEHALNAVISFGEDAEPVEDAQEFASVLTEFAAKHGPSFNFVLFTFMAKDNEADLVCQFMKELVADDASASILGGVKLEMQFLLMSKTTANATHERILTQKF